MNPSKWPRYRRFFSLIIGLLLVFGNYQNCTLYESPDRKTMNEKGFPADTSCTPYMTQEQAAEILNDPNVQVVFLPPDSNQPQQFLTCAITGSTDINPGLKNFRCSFSTSSLSKAKAAPPDAAGGLITTPGTPSSSPNYLYSYFRQDVSETTTVITVGALEGHTEGVNCGSSFNGIPSDADKNSAALAQQALVKVMVNGTPAQ
jgi:hypothetical protein